MHVRDKRLGGGGDGRLYLEVRDVVEVEREEREGRWMDWSGGMSVDNG